MNIRAILVGGIVASLVIAMWEMVVEAILPAGAGFFGAPIAIGATLVRDIQGSPNPIPFNLAGLVLGLAGHMMNSVVFAVIFGVFVGRRGLGLVPLLGAGMAWGVLVFVMMWFVVAPAVDPVLRNLNGGVFFLGHLMWGAALGFLWSRFAPEGQNFSLRSA